jgi:hypothetical protein
VGGGAGMSGISGISGAGAVSEAQVQRAVTGRASRNHGIVGAGQRHADSSGQVEGAETGSSRSVSRQ